MNNNYFRFEYYGYNWGDLISTGRYVFQNVDNKVNNNTCLAQLVFCFIVDYDLKDLELFFKLAGFNSFTIDEMPDSITNPKVIPLVIKESFSITLNGFNRGDIIEYIEKELGNGIVSKFYEVKKAQLSQEKAPLCNFLESIKMKKIKQNR